MAKLSKAQAKNHEAARRLLEKDVLTEDDKWYVLEHWQESATNLNNLAGAYFTPLGLARDLNIIAGNENRRVIDLCAGIGTLAFFATLGPWIHGQPELVCVEKNPDYAAVGRKLLPDATWIVGDVFDLPDDLGLFDCAIGNPPFGATSRHGGSGPRYSGRSFEYHVIDVARDLARYGVFIIPQDSAPFSYSGQQSYHRTPSEAYDQFHTDTGIELEASSIDTSICRSEWRGVTPATEVVTVDFDAAREPEPATPLRDLAIAGQEVSA